MKRADIILFAVLFVILAVVANYVAIKLFFRQPLSDIISEIQMK